MQGYEVEDLEAGQGKLGSDVVAKDS